jgi:hypothetical protein
MIASTFLQELNVDDLKKCLDAKIESLGPKP